MTTTVRAKSPLVVDLAISRTLAAALRATSAKGLTEQDFTSAGQLKSLLKDKLTALGDPSDLSEAVVPRQEMRDQLRQTLVTLQTLKTGTQEINKELLADTIRLLERFVGRKLSADDASTLISQLLRFQQSTEQRRPSLPEIRLARTNGSDGRST